MGENNIKGSILYEILVLSEWLEDNDNVISKQNAINGGTMKLLYFNPWKWLWKSYVDNVKFLQTEYPWHLSVSKDGKVAAVLQETLLQIKAAKDEYSSTVGKTYVASDQCPKLRRLAWSPDNSFLAVARDNGVVNVFNLFGCNVATIETGENDTDIPQPVVGLCFLNSKFKSTKWSNELMIVYHKGNVKSILLSLLDGQESEENINYSLANEYPQGISAVAYDSQSYTLLLAGATIHSESGLSVWRILNDYPYLKRAFDEENSKRSSRSILRMFSGISNHNPETIIKMTISPDSKTLACLHISGKISLWNLPAIVFRKKWGLHEQPEYNLCNPQGNDLQKKDQLYFHPVDIEWWSNDALAVARRNGAVTVCSSSTLENLLGDFPEFFSESPQICCVKGVRSEVILLECETSCNYKRKLDGQECNIDSDNETSVLQESIQAALYSFTDIERFKPKRKTPKIIQRIYRMISLRSTTPEELYTRKINNKEYEEALLLAQKYKLDCDLVYQKRWRNCEVSNESICNYLEKIKKVLWVVNECVERVPDEFTVAKELLEFGLKKTDIKLLEKLTIEERQLVIYRKQLLKYLDYLSIYAKIIGSPSKYSGLEYGNFRKKTALVATVDFAREENWAAISIMLTYMGNKVLPYWLPILSCFPETLKPVKYSSLLPKIVEDNVVLWKVRQLRQLDWSEMPPYQALDEIENDADDIVLYKSRAYLREFQADLINADIVNKWYKKRTYEIENNTGVVSHALSLLTLARERGVKALNKLHNNLLTLETLVYYVGDENMTLQRLEALTHFEQCKLLLSKTDKNSFISHLSHYIVPFSKRCNEQGCHTPSSILRDILLNFSKNSLEFPLMLLHHLKSGFANPFSLSLNETAFIVLDCVYSCPKLDQVETCFHILECLPERPSSPTREDIKLHDRIDKLVTHLEVCEILGLYEIPKLVRYIEENENNEAIGRELMENMAELVRRECLDFGEFLSDLQVIQSKVFPSVTQSFMYELCALSQMTSENKEIIQSAESILECRKGEKNKMIPFERSLQLVLQAARCHFEKANNFDDYYIELSQTCLRLICEPNPQIYEELDLIEAVQLLGDFEVKVLPLQVRKHGNRIKLIEACLKAKPQNYRSCQKILQLAQALRIHATDRTKREGEVLLLIAEYALNSSDYQYCSEICNRLITRNFAEAWAIVQKLAQTIEYDNKSNKQTFLAFAMSHCPVENLEELIKTKVELTKKNFYVGKN